MKMQGSFDVKADREQVYGFLTDPKQVAGTLPDSKPTDIRDDGFTIEARVGVGPMRGTVTTRLDIAERDRANVRSTVVRARGWAASST